MLTNQNTVDDYLRDGCGRCDKYKSADCKVHQWKDILIEARNLLQNTDLKEEIKWGQPTYTWNNKVVLLLSAYKNEVIISFFKGSLLTDPQQVLVFAGPNSKVAKVIKFQTIMQVSQIKNQLTLWVEESKTLIDGDFKPEPTQAAIIERPIELIQTIEFDEEYKKSFNSLTPGRQRGYLIHFNAAKKSTTRLNRIQKCRAKVLTGKGLNER